MFNSFQEKTQKLKNTDNSNMIWKIAISETNLKEISGLFKIPTTKK
jgi:sRNA-binding regulator protein Hfq